MAKRPNQKTFRLAPEARVDLDELIAWLKDHRINVRPAHLINAGIMLLRATPEAERVLLIQRGATIGLDRFRRQLEEQQVVGGKHAVLETEKREVDPRAPKGRKLKIARAKR